MSTDIQQYIDSGMLEAYVTGAISPVEERELLLLKQTYPEVREALYQLENDLEAMAQSMAVLPPPRAWDKIEAQIDDLILRERTDADPFTEKRNYDPPQDNAPHYIDVESESSHMRIHKAWKWVFAAVFVLGKIFLGTAIYFYLENRQAQLQIKELKTEIQALK